MPPKKIITNVERNRQRDRRPIRADWLRQRKPSLSQRYSLYGISVTGTIEILADRLMGYLLVEGDNPAQAQVADASDAGLISEGEDNSSNASVISAPADVHPIIRLMTPLVNIQPIIQIPVDEPRALIREKVQIEVKIAQTEPEIITSPPPISQLSPHHFHLVTTMLFV